ncbi:hypothetical protein [Nitrosopumilus sp.]|uniref:hypothetical protein n=1 Tax=Nitrosopumilus sp. TaxID=2024843 RepID=UPI0034A0115A
MTNKNTWVMLLIAGVSILFALSANDIYAIHGTEEDSNHDMHEDDTSLDSYFTDANPAPPKDKTMMTYATVHDIGLVVVYESTQGIMHSKDFTYYSQVSGFDRTKSGDKVNSDKPTFVLEGLVTPNHHMLYDMVDYVWEMQDVGYKMKYGQSDFYIGLVQDNVPVRVFKYTDCKIIDYKVDTLYDGVFTYDPNGGGARAFVDIFTYECDGFKPLNEKSIADAKTNIHTKLMKQNTQKTSDEHIANKQKQASVSQVLPENTWNK